MAFKRHLISTHVHTKQQMASSYIELQMTTGDFKLTTSLPLPCIHDAILAGGTQNIASVDAGFLRGKSSPLHWSNRHQKGENRNFNKATARPHLPITHQTRRHGPPWSWRRLNNEVKNITSLIFCMWSTLYKVC